MQEEAEDFESGTVAKRLQNHSEELQEQVVQWIECLLSIELHISLQKSLQEQLKSGVLLCQCMNVLYPGKIKRINTKTKLAFHHMENINKFLLAARDIGLPSNQLFTTTDLFEAKDMRQVLSTIAEVSAVSSRCIENYQGPVIMRGTGSSPAIRRKVIIKTQKVPSPFSPKKNPVSIDSKPVPSSPQRVRSSLHISSFDGSLGGAALLWIEKILSFEYDNQSPNDWNTPITLASSKSVTEDEFHDILKDGSRLCRLLGKISPEHKISTIHEDAGRNTYKHRENIELYLNGCKIFGLPTANCFSTNDLVERKNLPLVVSNIYSLSKFLGDQTEWNGPLLQAHSHRTQVTSISIEDRMKSDLAQSVHQVRQEVEIPDLPSPSSPDTSEALDDKEDFDITIDIQDNTQEPMKEHRIVEEEVMPVATEGNGLEPIVKEVNMIEEEEIVEKVVACLEEEPTVESTVETTPLPDFDLNDLMDMVEDIEVTDIIKEAAEEPQETIKSEQLSTPAEPLPIDKIKGIEEFGGKPKVVAPVVAALARKAPPSPNTVKMQTKTLYDTPSKGWFASISSAMFGTPEGDAAPTSPSKVQSTPQKSLLSSLWQETSNAFSEIVTVPTEVVAAPSKAPVVRGKLRGFQACFDKHLGTVRLQAFEMLSEEMVERIEEIKGENSVHNKVKEILTKEFSMDDNFSPPYLSEKSKQIENEVLQFKIKAKAAIQKLKQTFGGEKTDKKNVVQHTNNSLHITHDSAQDILAELASLAVELSMRIGESWLIAPLLSQEELADVVVPPSLSREEHQAHYANQLLGQTLRIADEIRDIFIDFSYRVGTAGKIRLVRSCSDADVEQFGKAIDAMTTASVSKIDVDFESVKYHIESCKNMIYPVVFYASISSS